MRSPARSLGRVPPSVLMVLGLLPLVTDCSSTKQQIHVPVPETVNVSIDDLNRSRSEVYQVVRELKTSEGLAENDLQPCKVAYAHAKATVDAYLNRLTHDLDVFQAIADTTSYRRLAQAANDSARSFVKLGYETLRSAPKGGLLQGLTLEAIKRLIDTWNDSNEKERAVVRKRYREALEDLTWKDFASIQ